MVLRLCERYHCGCSFEPECFLLVNVSLKVTLSGAMCWTVVHRSGKADVRMSTKAR